MPFTKSLDVHKISLKNVQNVHVRGERPFFLAFLNRESGNLFYLDSQGKKGTYVVSFNEVVNNVHEWKKRINARIFSGFEFSILTIGQMHLANAPYQLMKSGEFHNHICPCLWTGYFISRFVSQKLSPDEELIIFAIPPFCKDDALQIMLDSTVGKRSLYVREMLEEERKIYPHLAGVYVFWDKKKDSGRALILKFSLSDLRKTAKIDEKEYPWLWRMKPNQWIAKNISSAEKALEIIKEVPLDKKKLEDLKRMRILAIDL